MPYSLECDSCEFDREAPDEVTAYSGAKQHESNKPDHFVFVERVQ